MSIKDFHIKHVRVENYKSLKGSEIDLKEGLNIVIGRNGAGKSNLIDFMRRYASRFPFDLLKAKNTNYTISYEYIKGNINQYFSFSLEKVKADYNRNSFFGYEVVLNKVDGAHVILKDKKLVFKHGIASAELLKIQELLPYEVENFKRFYDTTISFLTPQDILWVSTPGKITINRDDDNSIVFDEYSSSTFFYNIQFEIEHGDFGNRLTSDGRNSADEIKEKIKDFLSKYLDSVLQDVLKQQTIIQSVRFNPNINVYLNVERIVVENLFVEFYIGDEWVPWSFLSDGTKRVFYLISESLNINQGILLVEEPELGIHPHQLYKIMDFLKEQSRNKQIIISTHSPLVLDALDENELDRIIIAKYDNGTKFNHLSKAQIAKAKKYMNEVGELSYYWLHSDLEE